MDNEIKRLFSNSEFFVFNIYQQLIRSLENLGKINVEPKKTSLHITNRVAFLGLHPKKSYIELNIVTNLPLKSPRIFKSEQISAHRFHNRLRIADVKEIDSELLNWLKESYKLCE